MVREALDDPLALFAVVVADEEVFGVADDREAIARRAAEEEAVVEVAEGVAAELQLLEHGGDGLVHLELVVGDRFGGGGAVGAVDDVGAEGGLEVVGQTEVVDDEAAGLVVEDAVDAGDGLHQVLAAHRLVEVAGMEGREVKAGQPHIADDGDAEGASESLKRSVSASLRSWLRMWGCKTTSSPALPVLTTLS